MEKIAQAVAVLLAPTITSSVEKAIQTGLELIRRELVDHTSRINEAEKSISSVKEELYQAQAFEQSQDKANQLILQKRKDLENRLRRNNLRFVGVLESLHPSTLLEFCATRIPEALGLNSTCVLERAHRLLLHSADRE